MRGAGAKIAVGVGVLSAALACAAVAGASDFTGKTTLDLTLTGDPDANFGFLSTGAGEPHLVRSDLIVPKDGRDTRRTSLAYFGQISDLQLADEESPARVEFFDGQGTSSFSNAGHRPQETVMPHEIETSIREMNEFAGASPVQQGDGTRAPMDEVLLTGDLADSNEQLEGDWVKTLAEGGTLDPNSGQDPTTSNDPFCAALGTLAPSLFDDPAKYTGVQDYDDYQESNLFYDPDQPAGMFSAWPSWPGLVDKAQTPFTAQGISVPSYITPGNHDVLVQGNLTANAAFERVATGCIKPIGPFPGGFDPASIQQVLNPTYLTGLVSSDPSKVAIVPPDNRRTYMSKAQYRQTFAGQVSSNGHGFGYIDPAQLAASNGSALYYSFSPKPGIRFISLDTNSSTAAALVDPVGGSDASNGNIDDPQWQWLKAQLDDAQAKNELVITYSHHASSSMTFSIPDEGSNTPCGGVDDGHGHDVNPGCDVDPRSSSPIHLGEEFVNLLCQYPNVIAEVAGHSHENRIDSHPCQNHDGFWEIKSPAIADWPTQSRLLEVMDNHDGTLSIFGTMINHEGQAAAPAAGTAASGMSVDELASVGRTISFNDFQAGGTSGAAGQPKDRNVELLLDDPRDNARPGGGSASDQVYNARSAGACATKKRGTRRPDRLAGTDAGDLLLGRAGRDRIRGLAGDDCLKGGRGRDKLKGGPGSDELKGGRGSDRIRALDGEVDKIDCGKGRRDRVAADSIDVILGGCERVRRP